MLTVFLIRAFTLDLVDHAAKMKAANAVTLAPAQRRSLGVGNATGLGMAPFLINHPACSIAGSPRARPRWRGCAACRMPRRGACFRRW